MRILVFLLLLGAASISKGQTPSDSIFVYKNFIGYKFYQKNVRLNFNQRPYIMEGDQTAHSQIKKVGNKNTISSILSGTGGFLIGLQLVTALVGGDANWTIVVIGGGLFVVFIPIYSKSDKQSLEAVNLYNAGLGTSIHRPILRLGAFQNGNGFRYEF